MFSFTEEGISSRFRDGHYADSFEKISHMYEKKYGLYLEIIVVIIKNKNGDIRGRISHRRARNRTSRRPFGMRGASLTSDLEKTIWTLLGHPCNWVWLGQNPRGQVRVKARGRKKLPFSLSLVS